LEATNSIGTNSSRDLFYQWFRESANNLVGETQEGLLKIPDVMEADEGNYFVALMNEGCISEASNMVNVEVDAIPEETAFILDDAGSFCAESEVIVEAVQPTMGTGQWSVTNSTATIVDAVNNTTLITNLDPGGNTILWSLSFRGCENYSTDTDLLLVRLVRMIRVCLTIRLILIFSALMNLNTKCVTRIAQICVIEHWFGLIL